MKTVAMAFCLAIIAGCVPLEGARTDVTVSRTVAEAAIKKCLYTVNQLTDSGFDSEIDHAYVEVSRERLVIALTQGKDGFMSYSRSRDYRNLSSCQVVRNHNLDIVSVREGGTFEQLLPDAEYVIETVSDAPVVLEHMEYRRTVEGFELITRQSHAELVRTLDNHLAREFAEQQIRGLARLQELDGRAVVDLCLDQYRKLSGGIDPTINLATLEMWPDGVSEVRFKATLRVRGWILEAQTAGGLPEYEMVFVEDDGSETWEPLPFVICRTKGSPPEIVLLVDGTRYLVGDAWLRRYPDYLLSVDYRKRGDRFLFEKLDAPRRAKWPASQ